MCEENDTINIVCPCKCCFPPSGAGTSADRIKDLKSFLCYCPFVGNSTQKGYCVKRRGGFLTPLLILFVCLVLFNLLGVDVIFMSAVVDPSLFPDL